MRETYISGELLRWFSENDNKECDVVIACLFDIEKEEFYKEGIKTFLCSKQKDFCFVQGKRNFYTKLNLDETKEAQKLIGIQWIWRTSITMGML